LIYGVSPQPEQAPEYKQRADQLRGADISAPVCCGRFPAG
jgi:hypothetical protein